MRRVVIAALLVALLATPGASADTHEPGWVGGFEFPESAYWDGPTGSFYVSNFGGSELEPDGREADGYISRLSGDGHVVAAKWVTGLRSPKGIRRVGERLYVADAGQLVVIDIAAAAIEATVDLDAIGARFPNDVAVDTDSGDVYVSDMMRNAIYRFDPGSLVPEVFVESEALEFPNGLLVHGGQLIVASFGAPPGPDAPKGRQAGRLLRVDLRTGEITPFEGMPPSGRLDGVEALDGRYLVTDNPGGRLLRVAPDGSVEVVADDLTNPADLGLRTGDRVAAIPELSKGTVRFLTLR